MKRNSKFLLLYLLLLPSFISTTPRAAQGFNPQPEPPGKAPSSESEKKDEPLWQPGSEKADEPLWEPAPEASKQPAKKLKKPPKTKDLKPQADASGKPPDPASIRGFNPQPEPPGKLTQLAAEGVQQPGGPPPPAPQIKKTAQAAQQSQ